MKCLYRNTNIQVHLQITIWIVLKATIEYIVFLFIQKSMIRWYEICCHILFCSPFQQTYFIDHTCLYFTGFLQCIVLYICQINWNHIVSLFSMVFIQCMCWSSHTCLLRSFSCNFSWSQSLGGTFKLKSNTLQKYRKLEKIHFYKWPSKRV